MMLTKGQSGDKDGCIGEAWRPGKGSRHKRLGLHHDGCSVGTQPCPQDQPQWRVEETLLPFLSCRHLLFVFCRGCLEFDRRVKNALADDRDNPKSYGIYHNSCKPNPRESWKSF